MVADWNSSTNRNWRYHKDLMMWLTKDPSYPEPTPINAEAERGSYIFFNHQTWQRARVSKRLPCLNWRLTCLITVGVRLAIRCIGQPYPSATEWGNGLICLVDETTAHREVWCSGTKVASDKPNDGGSHNIIGVQVAEWATFTQCLSNLIIVRPFSNRD